MRVVATLVSFPVVSLLALSIAAKKLHGNRGDVKRGRGYRFWHPKRLIFRYHYCILEFKRVFATLPVGS
jgi:hypothetical protein